MEIPGFDFFPFKRLNWGRLGRASSDVFPKHLQLDLEMNAILQCHDFPPRVLHDLRKNRTGICFTSGTLGTFLGDLRNFKFPQKNTESSGGESATSAIFA